MLVVMQEGAAEESVQRVIDRLVTMGFTVHRSTGTSHTVLGGVGPMDDFEPAEFEVMEGVKECHRIVSPYKLANKRFRPQGTVVEIGKEDRRAESGDDGRAVQRRKRRADFVVGGVGGQGRREGHSRRGVQAALIAVQFSRAG